MNPMFLLQISLGIYFGILGMNGLAGYGSRGGQAIRLFGSNQIFDLIVSIILLAAGIFLVAGIFVSVGGSLAPIFYIAVIIIWAVYIILRLFVNGFLAPTFLTWLSELALRVTILSGLWIVSRKDF